MKIEEIKERISKKESQIEKINKRIKKWEDSKNEKSFKKRYDWLIKNDDDYPRVKERFYDDYIKECNVEIKRANRDLADAMAQLEKYQGMLYGETLKANTEKIQSMVDFLEEWKKQATKYVEDNMSVLNQYHIKEREYITKYNDWKYRKEHKEEMNKLSRELRDIKDQIHPWTSEACKNNYDVDEDNRYVWKSSEVNYDKLNQILADEAENKYWELVNRIKKVAGNIVDTKLLKIGPKGNLEGVVVGDQETVRVETIVAGGWNAGRIVNVKRGPIAHYRTLVTPIRG